jgi:hypothetical protein
MCFGSVRIKADIEVLVIAAKMGAIKVYFLAPLRQYMDVHATNDPIGIVNAIQPRY